MQIVSLGKNDEDFTEKNLQLLRFKDFFLNCITLFFFVFFLMGLNGIIGSVMKSYSVAFLMGLKHFVKS